MQLKISASYEVKSEYELENIKKKSMVDLATELPRDSLGMPP
jgi:hypothetical protein